MSKVCLIAQFPPPMHGLSKAVETLYKSNKDASMLFQKIDITNNKRFILNSVKILFSNADLYYLTISQSKWGNIRDLMLLKIISLKKKKFIIHLHGGYFDKLLNNDIAVKQKKINYQILGKAEKIIVLSESLKNIFKGIVEDSKIEVIYNCVDDEFLASPEEMKKKIIRNNKVKKVLYLSNFIKEKGYMYVLKLALLEKNNYEKTGIRNFQFCFAGKFFNKSDESEFYEYIRNNNLSDIVTYAGVVNGEKKKELLLESDIFVLLTSYHKEGQPISIIEALGNGNVIISTNHAAIPDMIKNIENGIMVDKDKIDINEIYSKMQKLDYMGIMNNNYKEICKYKEDVYLKKMYDCFNSCM